MATEAPVSYNKPLPKITEDNEGFWASCKEHQMKLQKCSSDGKFRYFPSPICPYCGSFDFEWTAVSGLGSVYSYSVVHRPPSDAWLDKVPYVYAIVELAEGPLLPSNIVGIDPEQVRVGMKVKVTYDDVTPEITIPKFEPV